MNCLIYVHMRKLHYIIILIICLSGCKHENTNTQCIYFDFTRHMKDIRTNDNSCIVIYSL